MNEGWQEVGMNSRREGKGNCDWYVIKKNKNKKETWVVIQSLFGLNFYGVGC